MLVVERERYSKLVMVSMQISSPTGGGYGDYHRHPGNATANCISGFFRRLLCKNLPTVQPPDDDYEDLSRTGSEGAEEERKEMKLMADMAATAASPSPNIVARLMGLESMPEFDWMPRTPDSLGRCRSANSSFHGWFDSDPIDLHKSHRRAKTSSSFRENPTFLRQENDDFLLLSFDFDRHKEIRSIPGLSSSTGAAKEKKRDSSKSCEEKSHEAAQVKKKCDSEIVASRKKVSERKSGSTGEDGGRESKSKLGRLRRSDAELVVQQEPSHSSDERRKVGVRKGKIGVLVEKKAESDSSSENSSPVSVLDRPFEAESEFPPPGIYKHLFNSVIL